MNVLWSYTFESSGKNSTGVDINEKSYPLCAKTEADPKWTHELFHIERCGISRGLSFETLRLNYSASSDCLDDPVHFDIPT